MGWQRQANAISVQQVIEDALYQLTHTRVAVYAAGRTDAGVHALGQVAHFDLHKSYDVHLLMKSLNYFVRPYPIGILDCELVSDGFHARFSAIARHYMYRIVNRTSNLILDAERAWLIILPLDIKAMQNGANYLIGHHDFSAYRAKHCQASNSLRTISQIKIVKQCNNQIYLYFAAPSFLHHMVRNIVGSLALVGTGKWPSHHIKTVLDSKQRDQAGATAPACGLYLHKVEY